MKHAVQGGYLEKAKSLTRVQAEQVFSRMLRKMRRRIEDKESSALEAVSTHWLSAA